MTDVADEHLGVAEQVSGPHADGRALVPTGEHDLVVLDDGAVHDERGVG